MRSDPPLVVQPTAAYPAAMLHPHRAASAMAGLAAAAALATAHRAAMAPPATRSPGMAERAAVAPEPSHPPAAVAPAADPPIDPSTALPADPSSRRSAGPGAERMADPASQEPSGRWHTGRAIPVPIAEIAGAAIGQAVYTGGGFTPPGGSIGRWFGRYDATDDAWAPLAELPVAVHHPMMAAADDRIWLAGGYTGRLQVAEATRRLDAYDPATDAWTAMPDMPGRRAAGFLVALDGRLHVVGGIGDAPDRMWIYDVAAGAWSDAPGPTPREHLGAAASGGRVYVVAGRGYGRGNVGLLEAYDPAAGAWERLPDMPGVCGGCSAAATADGRIHVTGGEGGGRTYGEHYVYDPEARAWHVAEPMPTTRHGIAAVAVGERFYVLGGGRQQGLDYSTVVEWWAPDAEAPTGEPPTVTAPSPTPGAPATAPATPAPAARVALPASQRP